MTKARELSDYTGLQAEIAAAGAVAKGLVSQQVFTASGTWTKPTGVTKVKVYITAGGGGAMSGANTHKASGGAGGTAIKVIDVSAISSVSVTIGAYGTSSISNTDAGNGGSSSFGSHCSATGGTGGTYNNVGWAGGAGGVGSGGDINLYGTGGEFETGANTTAAGGGSFWGGGGSGSEPIEIRSNGHHGGGGGALDASDTSYSKGGAGLCVVEEYK